MRKYGYCLYNRGGFTLIEILLVVLIIAMASTWGAFSIYQGLDSTALRSGSLSLQRVGRYGRLVAGQMHRGCQLHVNLDEGTYWLSVQKAVEAVGNEKDNKKTEQALMFGNDYGRIRKLPEKLRFSLANIEGQGVVTSGEVSVNFYVDGSAQAGLIQISSDSETQTLMIYPCTARVELVSGVIDVLPSDTIDLDVKDKG